MPKKNYAPLQFIGNKQGKNVKVLKDGETDVLNNYIPDPELTKAVNLSLLLEMPLLVMGEPGCGKSLLAKAIAYDLYKEHMYEYYREWHIKSSSKAVEGLYEFDHIHRLRDATTRGESGGVANIDKYIHLGEMGEAFQISIKPDKRAVLLIDEIDKADLDFPNDLLNELDRMEFEIREKKIEEVEQKTKRSSKDNKKSLPATIKAPFRPIVIITSNSEKDLPDAFLRRCIFHYIEPLSEARLREIIIGRFYDKGKDDPLIDKAIKLFINLRDTIKKELLSVGKNVSTSEFINWFQALKHYNELNGEMKKADKDLVEELATLNPDQLTPIPFKNILLKNINSVIRFNETQDNA